MKTLTHAGGDEGQVSARASDSRWQRGPRPVDPVGYTPGFSYRGSRLYCEGVPVEEAAKQVGTPAYLYSRASIEQAYRRMDSAFGALPHTICYAVKANSNLGILRIFAALGSGFDIVSGGELYRLRRIGVPGNSYRLFRRREVARRYPRGASCAHSAVQRGIAR